MNRIVFLGSATFDLTRIQRPSNDQIVTLEKQGWTLAFVDPMYQENENALDADLPARLVWPMLGARYFSLNPVHIDATLVIYDCTGANTRTSLLNHGLLHPLSMIHYYPIGCCGTYEFVSKFEPNPEYRELFSISYDVLPLWNDGRILKYAPNRLLAANETLEYNTDICNLVAYIKARFFIRPTPEWCLMREGQYRVNYGNLVRVLRAIGELYTSTFLRRIDYDNGGKWLDIVRRDFNILV